MYTLTCAVMMDVIVQAQEYNKVCNISLSKVFMNNDKLYGAGDTPRLQHFIK